MRNNSFFLLMLLASFVLILSCQQRKRTEDIQKNIKIIEKDMIEKVEVSDCQEFIELHSASYLAKEYGKSEMWVLKNIKINLWQKESSKGKGRKVGALLPGSHALIIKNGANDYKVQNPLDKSIGWINKIQVNRTLFQNIHTYEPCS